MFATLAWAAIAGCARHEPDLVARVGDREISVSLLDAYARQRTGKPLTNLSPIDRQTLANQLVALVSLLEGPDAVSARQDPLRSAEFELAALLGGAALQLKHVAAAADPSESQLRALYARDPAVVDARELFVLQILSASEADAGLAIAEIVGGTPFADVARRRSTDPSAARGGELGWVRLSQLPDDLSSAIAAVPVGETSSRPARTRYGWLVLRVEQERELVPLAFEAVRAQLIQRWRDDQRRLAIQAAQRAARVEWLLPDSQK